MVTMPIIRPTLPPLDQLIDLIRPSWEAGTVTNGTMVKALEAEACRQTGAAHAVAMSSCTSGLILVPRALGLPAGGEVIVPSFTFTATAQALLWNGLVPVFCDCMPGTCTLDPEDVERNITSKTVAICAVSIYGLPPDIDALLDIGRRHGLPVYFDSAQGLGATYRGQPLGAWGACEVFSLSPTKVVTAVEGGIVTTNDAALADRLRSMRDYGRDLVHLEDMTSLGLSARMSELHAAVGLWSLRQLHEWGKARMARIEVYRERLGGLPGCWVQDLPANRTTSGNYFVLFISDSAKRSRDEVYAALYESGIQTKRYFYPPIHEQTVFQGFAIRVSATLPRTEKASREGLALPLYSHMTMDQLDTVCRAVEGLLG
ncbi:MAG: DegT/DnrJ/EryC1/StrS family aminotransferase [Nitrospiraceae bacterium]|nr:DegT/DnrJ/EryC1/StrS family aminotransferase [Nitrospiraceae bacterium]